MPRRRITHDTTAYVPPPAAGAERRTRAERRTPDEPRGRVHVVLIEWKNWIEEQYAYTTREAAEAHIIEAARLSHGKKYRDYDSAIASYDDTGNNLRIVELDIYDQPLLENGRRQV